MNERQPVTGDSRKAFGAGRVEADGAGLHCWSLALVLAFALLVRLAFFNGPFGSDDVVYLARSLEIANGVWTSANYNGALRYGFNIPTGLFLYLFGASTFAANLWPLICSILEIAVVYVVAREIWGEKAALYGSLVLAVMPLHVAVATRVHADPVVSFFLTLSFALFFFASRRSGRKVSLLAGLAMGAVFWAKELAAVCLLAFVAFPLVWRRVERNWIFVMLGGLVMLGLHMMLMQIVSGDPLHLFKTVLGQVSRNFIGGGQGEDGVTYYFRYLFFDIRHTGIAPLIALWAVVIIFTQRPFFGGTFNDSHYVVIWGLALFAVLSIFPVSLSPIRFVMKQSNYLTLFVAPVAMLSGFALARLPKKSGRVLLSITLCIGVVLALLQQADYRVFTSNSKAVAKFANTHPDSIVVGTSNNSNISSYYAFLEGRQAKGGLVKSFPEAASPGSDRWLSLVASNVIYVVIDLETSDWVNQGIKIDRPLPCWQAEVSVVPVGLGFGNEMAGIALEIARAAPDFARQRVMPLIQRLARPKPATIFRVEGPDLWCGSKNQSGLK